MPAVSRRRRYPSDTSAAEWALLEPLLPVPACQTKTGGYPEKWPRREIVDGIRYIADDHRVGGEVFDDQVPEVAEVAYLDPRNVQAHASPLAIWCDVVIHHSRAVCVGGQILGSGKHSPASEVVHRRCADADALGTRPRTASGRT